MCIRDRAGGLECGILDRQLVQGQLAEVQVGIDVEFAQALHRQQAVSTPGALGRCVGQRGAAGSGHGIGFAALHFGLACRCRAVGFGGLGRQVAVDIEGVGLELGAQGLLVEVLDGQAAAEGAVVELQVQVFQGQAGGRALQAADQLDLAQACLLYTSPSPRD